MSKEKSLEKQKITRPPVVVVMGHIDHGKTKILDWYRKTKVVEQESGGITQHIGAYQIDAGNPPSPKATEGQRKITFIDTPGHEAFSKMRSRGAKVADIAILVVAADEGVKPQTKEAISIARENNLQLIVAINKVDKPEINLERVKQQLAEENILVESYGGKTPSVEISAKTGTNMDSLLEMILLVAELEDLKADPVKSAEGVVIEAHLDPKRGITSTLLVRNGTLKKGGIIVLGKSIETVKILEDFRGRAVDEADPSSPVLIAGFSKMPVVGEEFHSFEKKSEAENFVSTLPPEEEKLSLPKDVKDEERPVFNIILKADVGGSQEVLEESLKKIDSEAVKIKIIRSEIGDIGESDVKMAQATKLVTIVGFKVRVDPQVRELAESSKIRIVTGEVIYELLDQLKKMIGEMIPPEVKRMDLGRAKILKIFKKTGNKQIVGGRVEEGALQKNAKVEIQRNKNILGTGNIIELQRNKINTVEVVKGEEFGIMIDSQIPMEEGDLLVIFQEEIVKHAL